ncbi:MAG: YbaK/EbsC family protein [Anaerolineales bacterium]
MKYTSLSIQTQREFPNNARTQGFGWLVRAGYVTRENQILPLGEAMLARLRAKDPSFLFDLSLPLHKNDKAIYFPLSTGNIELAHCPSCGYAEQLDLAQFKKTPLPREEEKPLEKVSTPECNTIEALANLLNIPKEKTAKALMYVRKADNKFVFIAVRGDMQLSEAKLSKLIGEVKLADAESISRSGAEAGYASPIGLKDALILVDDLIPESNNLVAGANEKDYHLLNTNYPRDYAAEMVAELVQAKAGDACAKCGNPLEVLSALQLASKGETNLTNLMLALAETHHDDKGLTLPASASPFDVYLMHVPGKTIDTKAKAEELYNALQNAGIAVLFDDRDERAGVKFNDADLIGCPVRLTVGEKGLQNGMVELKKRSQQNIEMISLDQVLSFIL